MSPWRHCIRFPVALSFLLLQGCGVSTRTTIRDEGGGNLEPGYSVEASIVGKDRSQLERARALARDGDYAGGIALLEALEERPLDTKLRREVLLALGEMYGAPLNPQPDFARASFYLEELLATDPDPELAERVRRLLEQYSRQ